MRKFCFRIIFLLLLLGCGTLHAAERERRVENYRRAWSKLIPSYVKTQMYGGIGIVSLGTGWDYGKKDFCETDILFGFVPKYEKAHPNFTFTVKQNFIPWHKHCGTELFVIDPLTAGFYFSTIMDDEFWVREPGKYPGKAYYGFSTKVRTHVFLGQRISFDFPRRVFADNVAVFYEVNTSDYYIVSKATNKWLKMKDILSFSFGVKIGFF